MRFALRLAALLAAGCFTYGSAFALGKVTADPNLGGAASKVAVRPDPRLAQKVTYEAKYTSVQKILADLTEMAGVKLLAGSGASDWPVRSRKMNIFVKDVPLSSLMDSIARVMKFRWSIGDTTPPTYRLIVDKKAAAFSDAQKARAENETEEGWRRVRQEWIDAIAKYGAWSPSQIDTLRQSDPVLHRYARYGAIKAIRALFEEVPEAKDRYAAGQSFRISTTKLSPQTKELIYSAGNEFWTYLQYFGKSKPIGYGNTLKPDADFDIAYRRIDTTSFTPNLRWGIWGMLTTGDMYISRGKLYASVVDLLDRNSDWNKYVCEYRNQVIDNKGERDAAGVAPDAQVAALQADRAKEEERLYPSEPLLEHLPFAAMDTKVKLAIEPAKPGENPVMATNNYIAGLQEALAKATGLGIVSDSWANIEGEKLPDSEMTLSDILDRFSKNYNYNWARSNSILEFRHRKWAKMRLNQIPDEWVAVWSENTAKKGYLSLDDLARISTLTYYQAEECIKRDSVLGQPGLYRHMLNTLDDSLQWLRLYASLSPELRALLMGQGGITGSGGVNGHMLTSEQWKLAQVFFDRIGSTRSDAVFRIEQVPSDTDVIYCFREIDTESGEADRTWQMTMPKYTPPAEAGAKQPGSK